MTYRVWTREWVAVYTSDVGGDKGTDECLAEFKAKYLDCVYASDTKVDEFGPEWPATLLLRIPIVRAEFRSKDDAEAFRRSPILGQTAEIYERGSDSDRDLESYGKKKLPT